MIRNLVIVLATGISGLAPTACAAAEATWWQNALATPFSANGRPAQRIGLLTSPNGKCDSEQRFRSAMTREAFDVAVDEAVASQLTQGLVTVPFDVDCPIIALGPDKIEQFASVGSPGAAYADAVIIAHRAGDICQNQSKIAGLLRRAYDAPPTKLMTSHGYVGAGELPEAALVAGQVVELCDSLRAAMPLYLKAAERGFKPAWVFISGKSQLPK